MPEGVSKQRVKNFLENNSEIAKRIKETIIDDEKWSEFRGEICSLIEKFSNNPTYETKEELDRVVSRYSQSEVQCKEAITEIFKGLGISQEVTATRQGGEEKIYRKKSGEYSREIFERLGIEYPDDIVKQGEREIQRREDKKYGIVRNSKSETKSAPVQTSRETKESKEKPRKIIKPKVDKEEKPKVKKQGKIKSAIIKAAKKAYYKITASVIMAPGTVPKSVLKENQELLDDASRKLNVLIDELQVAVGIANKADKESADSEELRLKLEVANEIKEQFRIIDEIVREIDEKEQTGEEVDKKDVDAREILLKIARKKVKGLEKAGLNKLIMDGDKGRRRILQEAKAILLPELENARDAGDRTINKAIESQEEK